MNDHQNQNLPFFSLEGKRIGARGRTQMATSSSAASSSGDRVTAEERAALRAAFTDMPKGWGEADWGVLEAAVVRARQWIGPVRPVVHVSDLVQKVCDKALVNYKEERPSSDPPSQKDETCARKAAVCGKPPVRHESLPERQMRWARWVFDRVVADPTPVVVAGQSTDLLYPVQLLNAILGKTGTAATTETYISSWRKRGTVTSKLKPNESLTARVQLLEHQVEELQRTIARLTRKEKKRKRILSEDLESTGSSDDRRRPKRARGATHNPVIVLDSDSWDGVSDMSTVIPDDHFDDEE